METYAGLLYYGSSRMAIYSIHLFFLKMENIVYEQRQDVVVVVKLRK